MERRPPWWCYLVLLAAVCSVASAGVAFKYIGDVPPLTLASWRLQLTSIILAVAASVQWRGMPAEHKARFRQDLRWTAFSGVMLALHFGTWVWSLEHTSLAHSLLLVSTTPIIIVVWVLLRRHAISAGEIAGAGLAVVGCAVLASGAISGKEAEVTLLGDLSAFAAAVAVVAHWEAGKYLRTYQPVFVYSAPATMLAAILLSLAGFALEDHTLIGASNHGVFGWVASKRYAPIVAYLGAVPGVVGHQGFNTVLKYMTPLMVSLAVQFEPVVGPFIGWATGVAAAPGTLTYIGGSIVLVATAGASVATALRQQKEERLMKSKSMHIPSKDASGESTESLAAGSGPAQRSGYKPVSTSDHDTVTVQGLHFRLHHDCVGSGHPDYPGYKVISVQDSPDIQLTADHTAAFNLDDGEQEPQHLQLLDRAVQQPGGASGVAADQDRLLPAGGMISSTSSGQHMARLQHAADAGVEAIELPYVHRQSVHTSSLPVGVHLELSKR